MIELLLLALACLFGWLLTRRQKPTEPPVTPPKKQSDPPKYEDKIDDIASAKTYPDDSDDALAAWLDDRVGKGKSK